MNRKYHTILLSSLLISAGWISISGFSVYQEETITPTATATLPWCEYTPTKRYQDIIPVYEFGATSTIDPLETETPVPVVTSTMTPTEGTITATNTPEYTYNTVALSDNVVSVNEGVLGIQFDYVWSPAFTLGCDGFSDPYICGDFYDYYFDTNDDNVDAKEGRARCYEVLPGGMFEVGDTGTGFGGGYINKHTRGCEILGSTDYDLEYPLLYRGRWFTRSISTLTPTPTIIPSENQNCREYTDIYKEADPFAEFDYNYIGNTCISLFDGIQLSLDDLPSVLLDAMDFLDTTGIFDISLVPELDIPGLQVCLDQYQPIITLMDVDLVSPLSIMITLVVIGGLINEFRS